ncbi:hypothetical protein AYJ54_45480 [Bradyrhizobium centrolobii]|uniref:Uncharacterized protein n=1 Tax=Bradyrhizobium centrolobii TaxID=1505087 RepID=A0A176YYZ7_9BRAD|nr:hypothetical protein AYJ54_45480 [Bradyrhizobium centrolobii]
MELDYRNLVRICEQQAALCADPRAREELKAMASRAGTATNGRGERKRFAEATTGGEEEVTS